MINICFFIIISDCLTLAKKPVAFRLHIMVGLILCEFQNARITG
jgi:hypothetical protein